MPLKQSNIAKKDNTKAASCRFNGSSKGGRGLGKRRGPCDNRYCKNCYPKHEASPKTKCKFEPNPHCACEGEGSFTDAGGNVETCEDCIDSASGAARFCTAHNDYCRS